ncbi:hypothetical protein BGZ76_010920 [Entomortierella beljakovae]|nr:hypothetical protein BGZ76_010920 [Entomortierella beljakovae]
MEVGGVPHRPVQGYLSMECIVHNQNDPSQSNVQEGGSNSSTLSMEDQLLLDELAEHFQEIIGEEGEIDSADDDPSISKVDLIFVFKSHMMA